MIRMVADNAASAFGREHVVVVSDDDRIFDAVHGFKCVKTSSDAMTGTDRVAEILGYCSDVIINVQGDEPMIKSGDIISVYESKIKNPDYVINGMARALSNNDKLKTIKVAVAINNDLLYASRSKIPNGSKTQNKQIGIYAFNKEQLELFSSFDMKTPCESCEDIEILRFLEIGVKVKMCDVSATYSVDYPEDIKIVEDLLALRCL